MYRHADFIAPKPRWFPGAMTEPVLLWRV